MACISSPLAEIRRFFFAQLSLPSHGNSRLVRSLPIVLTGRHAGFGRLRGTVVDLNVIEFAWQLPIAYKRRDGVPKWPLRQLLYRHVPRDLIDRPKRGFAVPLHDWLRGPLRDWAESLLAGPRLEREGVFNVGKVRTAWAEHLSGRCNWTTRLWTVLMFQAWLEKNHG